MWRRKSEPALCPEVFRAVQEKEHYEQMAQLYQVTSLKVSAARDEAKHLRERADASLAKNHFGQSITEAMKRKGLAG